MRFFRQISSCVVRFRVNCAMLGDHCSESKMSASAQQVYHVTLLLLSTHRCCSSSKVSLGMVGDSREPSTNTNYARAVVLFNEFLSERKLPVFDLLTKEHLKVDTMREFARYLIEYKSSGREEFFARDTVTQHLSGIKTLLCRKFGKSCFEENDFSGILRMSAWHSRAASDWYSVLSPLLYVPHYAGAADPRVSHILHL